MSRAGRYATQRSNRVRLKADCHAMLVKLGKEGLTIGEINEMLVRLQPPNGAAAPIELTGYTKDRKKPGPAPEVRPNEWNAYLVVSTDGRTGVRYREN